MLISARNLAVSAHRGPVYGPLAISIPAAEAGNPEPQLVIVSGAPGAGRTSLLLTLSGRMKPDSAPGSSLSVLGETHPRALQRQSGIAGFAGIDDLEDSVTVGAALRERLAFVSPWYARVPRLGDAEVATALGFAAGILPTPRADTLIWNLSESQQFALRIALALMPGPRILLVDNIDRLSEPAAVWQCLLAIAEAGTVVVAGVSVESPLPPATAAFITLDRNQN